MLIYADAEWAVVNKPHGIPVHDARGGFLDEIRKLPQAQGGVVHACHRLDATTAGALLVAFSAEAARLCGQMFESHAIDKRYLAIVHGVPAERVFSVDIPLEQVGSRARPSAGKEALTRFEVLAEGRNAALVLATPETGRFHQIRAHLQHAGHPVVGDHKYGGGHQKCVALHCARLAFKHPRRDEVIRAVAPLFEPFERVAARMGLIPGQLVEAMARVGTLDVELG